jgi:stress-induced morphogen
MGPVETRVRKKLQEALKIDSMDVVNDSARHKGHAGNLGGDETHFKITIISDDFKGKTRLECHRMVFQVLEEELKHTIHAMTLDLKAHHSLDASE